jgi:hypothetical protein
MSNFCDWLWWVRVISHSWQISSLLLPPAIAHITLSSVKLSKSVRLVAFVLHDANTLLYIIIIIKKLLHAFDIVLYFYYWHQIRVLHSKIILLSVTIFAVAINHRHSDYCSCIYTLTITNWHYQTWSGMVNSVRFGRSQCSEYEAYCNL